MSWGQSVIGGNILMASDADNFVTGTSHWKACGQGTVLGADRKQTGGILRSENTTTIETGIVRNWYCVTGSTLE
jgi:hypothetical protein